MEKIERATPDLTQENIDRIAALFPECVTEAENAGGGGIRRAIDFDVLRELLGDVAEGRRERYQFSWPGKAKARLEARTPTPKAMRPVPERSVDWDTTQNLYVEGDNLEALKIMRETYAGRVKLIYIDPPYNTGRDFIYDDDFGQTRAEYAAWSGDFDGEGGRLVANPESSGRFHSDWCSMMYPRLLLARDLLSADGAIFISIDDNEETNLQKMCSEIFGAGNFVAKLSVQINPRGRNLDRYVAKTTEPILIFVKDYSNGKCINSIPKDERMLSEYDREDAKGRFRAIGLRNRNQSFNPKTRPNLYYPLWICSSDGSISVVEDERHSIQRLPIASDGTPTCWTWSKDKVVSENAYIFGERLGDGWRVYRKDYLDEGNAATTLAKSLQIDPEFNNDYGKRRIKELFGSNVMSFPKSPDLMRRILQMGSRRDSLVMDFFSGSATLADAVLMQNAEDGGARKYIMIQLPEVVESESLAGQLGIGTICDLGEERIRRAAAKIRAEIEESNSQLRIGEEPRPLPDLGFRVLRVGDPALRDVRSDPASTGQASLLDLIDNMEEGATPLDLLFQVLPRFRIPYSCSIGELEADGRTVLDVGDGQLLACFDGDVSTATVEAIAKRRPLYAVFRDASFADDSAVANLEELFKTFSPDTIRYVI